MMSMCATIPFINLQSISILTSLHKLYIQIYGDKLCYEIYEIGNVYCTDAQIDENENCYVNYMLY